MHAPSRLALERYLSIGVTSTEGTDGPHGLGRYRGWLRRLHANAAGHARIADALAHGLGLPGTDDSWKQPLPEPPPRTRREWLAAEVAWTARFLLPWPWRALRARLEEPRRPRQPDLRPV